MKLASVPPATPSATGAAILPASVKRSLSPLDHVGNGGTPVKMLRTTVVRCAALDASVVASDAGIPRPEGVSLDATDQLQNSVEAVELLQKALYEGASVNDVLRIVCKIPDLLRALDMAARSLLCRWESGQPLENSERDQLSVEVARVIRRSGLFEPVSGLSPPLALQR